MKTSIPAHQQQAFARAEQAGKVKAIVGSRTINGRTVPSRDLEQKRNGRSAR